MILGKLDRAVFHIIRVEDNQLGALRQQFLAQLLRCGARTIGAVDFVDVDHLGAGDYLLNILPGFVVRLAPAAVVVRSHEQDAKSKFFRHWRAGSFNNRRFGSRRFRYNRRFSGRRAGGRLGRLRLRCRRYGGR